MFNFSLKIFMTVELLTTLMINNPSYAQSSKINKSSINKTYQSKNKNQKKDHQTLHDLEFNYHKILSEIRRKLEAESKQNNIQSNLLDDLKKKIKLLEIHHQEMVNNLKSSAPTPKLNQKIEIDQIINSDSSEWVEDLKKVYNTKAKIGNDVLLNSSQAEELPTTQKSVPSKTLDYSEQMIDTHFTPYKSVNEIIENSDEHKHSYD